MKIIGGQKKILMREEKARKRRKTRKIRPGLLTSAFQMKGVRDSEKAKGNLGKPPDARETRAEYCGQGVADSGHYLRSW
jgi:hypothetical protein